MRHALRARCRTLVQSSSGIPPRPHTFELAAVERGARDVVEVLTDSGTTEKKVAAWKLNPQCYTREKVGLTIF